MRRALLVALVPVALAVWSSDSSAEPKLRPAQRAAASKCAPGQEDFHGKCLAPCPSGQTRVVKGDGVPQCEAPPASKCAPGQEDFHGKCLAPCPSGQTRVVKGDGVPQCEAPRKVVCRPGSREVDGRCVAPCAPGKKRAPDGTCVAP